MPALSRRRALFGLLAAPAIIRTPGLLMPISAPRMRMRSKLFWSSGDVISIVINPAAGHYEMRRYPAGPAINWDNWTKYA